MRMILSNLILLIGTTAFGAPLRIMPLGDSITSGHDDFSLTPGGYRTTLYGLLDVAGYDVDFVGTLNSNPGPIPDNDHQGHGSFTIEQLRQVIGPNLVATEPDVILLHAGTNDVTWSAYLTPELTPELIAARLSNLLNEIYFYRPNVIVLVSTIIAARDAPHVAVSAQVNALFPAVVASHESLGHDVQLVDLRAVLTQDDLADSVHPSPVGYAKMGQGWFDAIHATVPIPEPSTVLLAVTAMLLAGFCQRRRRQ